METSRTKARSHRHVFAGPWSPPTLSGALPSSAGGDSEVGLVPGLSPTRTCSVRAALATAPCPVPMPSDGRGFLRRSICPDKNRKDTWETCPTCTLATLLEKLPFLSFFLLQFMLEEPLLQAAPGGASSTLGALGVGAWEPGGSRFVTVPQVSRQEGQQSSAGEGRAARLRGFP